MTYVGRLCRHVCICRRHGLPQMTQRVTLGLHKAPWPFSVQLFCFGQGTSAAMSAFAAPFARAAGAARLRQIK